MKRIRLLFPIVIDKHKKKKDVSTTSAVPLDYEWSVSIASAFTTPPQY